MMQRFLILLAPVVVIATATATDEFNILQHIGGNGQWFPGPEVTNISSEVPTGCTVDLAAFFSRHGSRYPDTGAYNEWTALHTRLQAAGNFTVTAPNLSFLKTWEPVLAHPERQIAQLSPTGYDELHHMGTTWRMRYPHLYEYNSAFALWANYYKSSPRVRDSARLFAQGFLGPNATLLGTVYALNSSDPASWMNSLATSDLCSAYADSGGVPYKDTWDNIYLPPIQARLNAQIKGFEFTQYEVGIIPYLCGFETQITGQRSPFCDLFTQAEVLQYEYAQDLRYWYGNGLGTDIEKYNMLPVLAGLVQRLVDGPGAEYETRNGTFVPPSIISAFTNDGQINQLIAATAVFDNEPHLPANQTLPERRFRASRLVPMRGTVAFERLSCTADKDSADKDAAGIYLRIRFNDVVYPVVNCTTGPGSSCPLQAYQDIIARKLSQVGDFKAMCNVGNPAWPSSPRATFFTDDTLEYATVIKP